MRLKFMTSCASFTNTLFLGFLSSSTAHKKEWDYYLGLMPVLFAWILGIVHLGLSYAKHSSGGFYNETIAQQDPRCFAKYRWFIMLTVLWLPSNIMFTCFTCTLNRNVLIENIDYYYIFIALTHIGIAISWISFLVDFAYIYPIIKFTNFVLDRISRISRSNWLGRRLEEVPAIRFRPNSTAPQRVVEGDDPPSRTESQLNSEIWERLYEKRRRLLRAARRAKRDNLVTQDINDEQSQVYVENHHPPSLKHNNHVIEDAADEQSQVLVEIHNPPSHIQSQLNQERRQRQYQRRRNQIKSAPATNSDNLVIEDIEDEQF